MKRKLMIETLVVFLAALILIPVSAAAADISGKWIAPAISPSGSPQGDKIFTFNVAGEEVTGTVMNQETVNATFEVEGQPTMVGKLTTQRGNPLEILEGKIAGNEVSFATVSTMGPAEVTTHYKGTISGNEIKFTAEMVLPEGFSPPGPPGAGEPKPQEFVAKKMTQ